MEAGETPVVDGRIQVLGWVCDIGNQAEALGLFGFRVVRHDLPAFEGDCGGEAESAKRENCAEHDYDYERVKCVSWDAVQ